MSTGDPIEGSIEQMKKQQEEAKLLASQNKEEEDLRVREAIRRAVADAAEIVADSLPTGADQMTRVAMQAFVTWQLSEQYRRQPGTVYTANALPFRPFPDLKGFGL